MDPWLRRLSVFVALLLGSTLTVQNCPNDHCQVPSANLDYDIIATEETYEERKYATSKWMCTDVASSSTSHVIAARNKLETYTSANSISDDLYPGLIVVTSANTYEMCWLVPSGENPSSTSDVTVKTFSEFTVFTRCFGGTPTISGGEQNRNKLKDDLDDANESFDCDNYYAAGYNAYLSIHHCNEIWCKKV